jgi:hypothetical protein
MDDSNGTGIVPDATDEHSAVLTMLASASWQSRLDEARRAREAVLARRGVTQDLPVRLRSAAPRRSPASGLGQSPTLTGLFPPPADAAGVDVSDAEEEFPDFFPETDDDLPVVREALSHPPAPYPWAHVPAVGPAEAEEPAHPAPVETPAPISPPARRTFRIAVGFGLGLAAGVAATSLAWMMTGPAGGPVPGPEALAPPAPAVLPQTATLSPPDATLPILSVATPSRPPEVALAPEGAGSPPEMPPNGPDITKVEMVARLSGSSDLPAPLEPPATDTQRPPESVPAPRPAPQASVPEVSFALQPENAALLPAAFAPPEPQTGLASTGTGRPDPAPRAVAPPPGVPKVSGPAPAETSIELAGAAARPVTAPLANESGPGRLQVNVMAPKSVAEADLAATITGLQDAGFRLGENDRVSFKVSKSHVRFYHATDRAAAEALAARIGGEARDFTSSDFNPPEGMIELWLQGSGPTVSAARPAKPTKKAARPQTARTAAKERKAPSEDAVMKGLRDKIVRQLQKGEHL